MLTEVAICNLAVSWLGGKLITSLDDDTNEGILCKANYESSRDAALEERDWTFATFRKQLNSTPDYPLFGTLTAFVLPSDHIRTLNVSDNVDFRDKVAWYQEGNYILANVENMYLRYIFRQTDNTRFSPVFTQVVAARLAHDICLPLTKNRELKGQMWDWYMGLLDSAGNLDGVQGPSITLMPNPQLITVR